MFSAKRVFVSLVVILGLLWLLGAMGMVWAESAAIMVTMMPLVLLTAAGINNLFIPQPDIIFGTPTTFGYAVVIIVDLLIIWIISKIISKLLNSGRRYDTPKI